MTQPAFPGCMMNIVPVIQAIKPEALKPSQCLVSEAKDAEDRHFQRAYENWGRDSDSSENFVR